MQMIDVQRVGAGERFIAFFSRCFAGDGRRDPFRQQAFAAGGQDREFQSFHDVLRPPHAAGVHRRDADLRVRDAGFRPGEFIGPGVVPAAVFGGLHDGVFQRRRTAGEQQGAEQRGAIGAET